MKKSQNTKVLEFMRSKPSINRMQAMEFLNVERLAARISELRDKGYKINADYWHYFYTVSKEGMRVVSSKVKKYILMENKLK